MLSHLHIRHVGLIEACSVDFLNGFTIITGETGAGKSMLIDALSLGLGARADTSLISQGAESAMVEVRFSLPSNHPAHALVEEYGLDTEEGEIFLRRQLSADKSRAFINGSQVTQSQLKRIGECLVDIHGQYDQQLILKPSGHVDMLDKFGHLNKERAQVRHVHNAWLDTHIALTKAQNLLASRAEEEILLTAYIDELDKLAPQTDEEATLVAERKLLMAGEKVAKSLQMALDALSGDVSITGSLGHAEMALANVSDVSPELAHLYERLANISHEATALISDLEQAGNTLEADPERLQAVDDRLFALKDCARKHNVTVDELPEALIQMQEKLEGLANLQGDISALEQQEKEARKEFEEACSKLTEARLKVAKTLAVEVENSLKKLEMPNTRFEAVLQPQPPEKWNESGAEKVEFMVATNVGSTMAPLVKIASGGEVSRLMLALKEVFYKDMPETTLIFDEIDTGVGGSVAEAMGLAMKELAGKHQVFSITHLAQVAAKGHRHVKIVKHVEEAKTQTKLHELDDKQRLDEVSRMLSGREITAEAQAAAAKLLAAG